jgi:hypothetical protein
MDILERAFLGTATAAGVVVLVALGLLLSVVPADPVPATVLQVLNSFHPAAAPVVWAGQVRRPEMR